METQNWMYSRNQFESVTQRNYKLTELISKQHDNALHQEISDASIQTMYNLFHPQRLTFNSEYVGWLTVTASRKAATNKLAQMMHELSSDKIEVWDIKIQNIYRQSSSEYIAILPNRRKPFQSGSYEERISALKSLAENMKDDTLLVDVHTLIVDFIASIEDTRNKQIGLDEATRKQSLKVEAARLACTELLYANLGGLMQKYYKTPKEIERFFDLEAIRTHTHKLNDSTEEYTLAIAPNTTKEAGIMFTETTKFLLFNNSSIDLYVYTGLENNTPNPTQMLCIAPDEEKEVSPSDIGMPGSRFLFVVNKDLHEAGELDISLLATEE